MTEHGGHGAVFRGTRMADLAELAAFVERACASVSAPEEAAADVRLATEEVFTNIVQHGYGGGPGPVTVRVGATPERITVTLTDDAPPFDPVAVPTPDLAPDWEEREPGGLGWHLVQQVVDEVRRAPGIRGGNVFTLVKRLSPGPPRTRGT